MQNTPKQLITHARPHLDDVAAVWLFKTFHPDFKEASLDFTPIGDKQPVIPDNAIAVGIGRGQFDEHKGDLDECAASLVWNWLKEQPEVSLHADKIPAIDRLVAWVKKEDLGQLNNVDWREWSVAVPVENYWNVCDGDNLKVYELGAKVLDALLYNFEGLVELDADWGKRIEFDTKWGKAVALESSAAGVSQRVYQSGAVLVVQIDPKNGSRQFRADVNTPVDFTDIYTTVREREPNASWFLHHSKRLLLCGSRSTPEFNPSQLTLNELIDLVKE